MTFGYIYIAACTFSASAYLGSKLPFGRPTILFLSLCAYFGGFFYLGGQGEKIGAREFFDLLLPATVVGLGALSGFWAIVRFGVGKKKGVPSAGA